MSASRIILDCLPSFCQNLSELVESWRTYNKNNFACFFLRHGVFLLQLSKCTITISGTLIHQNIWHWKYDNIRYCTHRDQISPRYTFAGVIILFLPWWCKSTEQNDVSECVLVWFIIVCDRRSLISTYSTIYLRECFEIEGFQRFSGGWAPRSFIFNAIRAA